MSYESVKKMTIYTTNEKKYSIYKIIYNLEPVSVIGRIYVFGFFLVSEFLIEIIINSADICFDLVFEY